MSMIWIQNMDWALFFSALVSSTLFPGGSEVLLIYRFQQEVTPIYQLVAIATLGNVLGSCITYFMGRVGISIGEQWLRTSKHKIERAQFHFNRYGTPALLFAWLPVVGDPLCLVAGSLKYSFLKFLLLVTTGKLFRYYIIALPFIYI